MLNEKAEIEVYGRKLTVQLEGLTLLEINALAQQLTERMDKAFRESDIADSHKLAIVAALQILDETNRVKAQQEVVKNAEDRVLDQMISSLESVLEE